ncbi:MAG: tetratricopeptide repeat protein [Elusimicrobiota bacterium]
MIFGISLAAGPARAAAPAQPVSSNTNNAEQAPPTLTELLNQISAAYRHKNYELGLSLVKKAFELKEKDVSSMDRIGSVYYALGRYGEALTVWTQALPLERNPRKRRALENSIAVTRRSLGLAEPNFAASPSTTTAAAAPPAPKAKELSPETKASVQALYKKGVKYYASGQYLQATTAFLRILELDPGNADATKALQRLKLDQ